MRGLAATSCLLMGCLITDDIEFPEEPVCPPAISTPVGASNPLNEIATVSLGSTSGEDAGTGTREETFDVTIWDCNVNQLLKALITVDAERDVPGLGLGTHFRNEDVPPRGTAERSYSFTFTDDELNNPRVFGDGCHKIELFVSSEFDGFSSRPETMGDIASATWWLIVDTAPSDGVEPSCP